MIERPIIFSAPMVKAILDGRKTQTRRLLYVLRKARSGIVPASASVLNGYPPPNDLSECGPAEYWTLSGWHKAKAGDRLWVKETGWERPERTPHMMREGADTWEPYYYDADGLTDADHEQFKEWGFKRRPSIFMPRWASRITLEVTGVRVERLQEISYEDSVAEGLAINETDRFEPVGYAETWEQTARRLRRPQRSFELLWGKINGVRAPWSSNPWVVVIEFRKV